MAKILSSPTTLLVRPPIAAPPWVSTLTAGGTWTELPASPVFGTWVAQNISPALGYVGYAPILSMRDAYTNPIFDAQNKKFAVFGGGHQSGTVNAVVVFDTTTLSYSIAVPPTPPAKYPPGYTGNGAIYPSGSNNGFFQTAQTLTNAADLPYAAPFAARQASHLYSAATFADGIFSVYYSSATDADTVRGNWSRLELNPDGPQLHGFESHINASFGLQAGTLGVRDWVRGKDWMTVIAGDQGDNWRNGVARFNRSTHKMEAYVALPQWVVSTSTICIAGNYLYVWSPTTTGSYLHQTYLYDYGFRVHLDTLAYEYVKLTGTDKPLWSDEKAQTEGASIETVPCFFDGTRIRFWNYGVAADRDAFYAVNLTPTGGAGTAASPYTMAVTREQRSASGMPNPAFTYTVDYIPDWGVAMVLPHGGTRWWALRL